MDITDNFESLNPYVIVGHTDTEALLEEVVGFLGGFVFLAAGIYFWLPSVESLSKEVAERKRTAEILGKAEEGLRISEARFRDFAESSTDWLWEMDEELRFTYLSPNVERVVGVPPEWHYGKTRQDILGDGYDREIWESHLEDLSSRKPFRDFTYLRVGEGVDSKWLSTSGKPIFDAGGVFRGYRGSGTDVTELKQREIALRKSEESLREILEKSPIGVAIVVHTRSNGHVEAKRLFANDALTKMFGGTSPDEMVESEISGTWADIDQFYQANEAMQNGVDLVDFEARRMRLDGTEMWLSMHARPVSFNSQACTMV
jgi:PAS domain S-box-containing protein